jgi:hypothetical protein
MSLKSAREKYLKTKKVSKEVFNKLKELDPSKSYKYLEAMCDMYENYYFYINEDDHYPEKFLTLYKIKWVERLIYHWDRFRKKGYIKEDINQLSADTIRTILVRVFEKYNIKFIEKNDTRKYKKTILENNDDIQVVIPHTDTASIKYGYGTQWCTAGTEDNRFNQYQNSNCVLYYFYFKYLDRHPDDPSSNSNLYKLAAEVSREEQYIKFWDVEDSNVYVIHWENTKNTEENLEEIYKKIAIWKSLDPPHRADFHDIIKLAVSYIDFSEKYFDEKYKEQNSKYDKEIIDEVGSYRVFNDDGTLDVFGYNNYIPTDYPIKIKNCFCRSLFIREIYFENLNIENITSVYLYGGNLKIDNWKSFSNGLIYDLDLHDSDIDDLKHISNISYWKLDVSNTKIKTLLNLNTQHLEIFNGSSNEINEIEVVFPEKMKEINLSKCKIKKIKGLPKKMNLLNLVDNEIEKIENLPQWTRRILLMENNIKSLPENLSNSNFESLNLSYNKIVINDIDVSELSLSNPRTAEETLILPNSKKIIVNSGITLSESTCDRAGVPF